MSYLSKIGSGLIYFGAFGSVGSAIAKPMHDGTVTILALLLSFVIAVIFKKIFRISFYTPN